MAASADEAEGSKDAVWTHGMSGVESKSLAGARPLASAAQSATTVPQRAGGLTVTFAGMESHDGAILLAVYDEAGWQGGRPVRVAMVDAATFADLPSGRYGVKAFDDLNGNYQMDVNPFDIPTEPFAF